MGSATSVENVLQPPLKTCFHCVYGVFGENCRAVLKKAANLKTVKNTKKLNQFLLGFVKILS